MSDTIEREDAIAETEAEEREVSNLDAASASEQENDRNQDQPESEKAESSPDGGHEAEETDPNGSDESEGKPSPEDEGPDWEQVAKKERWKRQRERDSRERLEKEIEELRRKAGASAEREEGAPQGEGPQPAMQSPVPKRPKRSDFDYDDEKYDAAVEKWQDQVIEAKIVAAERRREENQRRQEFRRKAETYQERLASYAASNEEFAKAYEEAGKPNLPPYVDEALMESDVGPEVEHYLYGNLDELNKVITSLPGAATRLIGRIEARIEGQKEASESVRSKNGQTGRQARTSRAPRPIDVETGGRGGASEPSSGGYLVKRSDPIR